MIPLPDASPLTDDLDDVTLHEPVTKENDMNEARASERADLVELRRLMEAASPLPYRSSHHAVFAQTGSVVAAVSSTQGQYEFEEQNRDFITAACNALPGLIAEVERLTQGMKEMKALAKRMASDYTCAIAEKNAEIQRLQGLSAAEPAATASRTVSEQELQEWLDAKRTAVLLPGGGTSFAYLDGDVEGLIAGMRIIPAPSAKCGTCRDEGAVYAIHTGWSDCPDCTPASAEQKTCVCGRTTKVCGPEYKPCHCSKCMNRDNEQVCEECSHPRACHKEDGKQ